MALTETQIKEFLSEAGTPAENIDTVTKKIMNGHVTSINALREQRDSYKEAADKLPGVQKELDALKSKGDPDWQKKFEDEHNALEKFKSDVEAEKLKTQKVSLYSSLLRECNVDESRINAVLKVTDLDTLSVKENKLENPDKLKEDIQKEWSAFILTKKTDGAKVDDPPENSGNQKDEAPSRAAQIATQYRENLYGKKEK